MQYINNFLVVKIENFISKNFFFFFAQNINCGYMLEPPLMSTHNMFWIKNKKNCIPLFYSQFYYVKAGFKGSTLHEPVFLMDRTQPESLFVLEHDTGTLNPHNTGQYPGICFDHQTCMCYIYPLTPLFHIVKLVFTGILIHVFLNFAPKHRLWVLVGTHQGGSNVYQQSMF